MCETCQQILRKVKIARDQYMGCGGNLSDKEVIQAMQIVLDEILAGDYRYVHVYKKGKEFFGG